MGQCIYTQTPPRWNVKNRCSRKAFCLVRQSLWASALDVCPFPHQIHLLPCPHSAQCPQRQNSVDHTNGLLGALVLATGSSGGCGREGGEWGQRAGVGSSLLGGSQLLLGTSGPSFPQLLRPLTSSAPKSQPWKLHHPPGPPRAWAHFCKVLFIGLSSNCLHLNMSSLFARIPSLSKTFVCSDTDISAAFLLKLTLKTVKSKLLQAIAKFFP